MRVTQVQRQPALLIDSAYRPPPLQVVRYDAQRIAADFQAHPPVPHMPPPRKRRGGAAAGGEGPSGSDDEPPGGSSGSGITGTGRGNGASQPPAPLRPGLRSRGRIRGPASQAGHSAGMQEDRGCEVVKEEAMDVKKEEG